MPFVNTQSLFHQSIRFKQVLDLLRENGCYAEWPESLGETVCESVAEQRFAALLEANGGCLQLPASRQVQATQFKIICYFSADIVHIILLQVIFFCSVDKVQTNEFLFLVLILDILY